MRKPVRKESRIATSPFPPQAHKPANELQWTAAPDMRITGNTISEVPGQRLPGVSVSGPHAQIKEQTILGQLDEALKWAVELDKHLASIRARLLGQDSPCESDLPQTTVEEKSSALSAQLAYMCGYVATILDRIGEVSGPRA